MNTFSANKSIIADANFQPAPEPEEYMPMKIKPVVEEAEGEDDDTEKEETKQTKPKGELNFGTLVAKATEYNKDLSKGNRIARAMEFSRQSETVFLKHFGFRYLISDKILGKDKEFQQIFEFIRREANGENIVKNKRGKSPKRKKSPVK